MGPKTVYEIYHSIIYIIFVCFELFIAQFQSGLNGLICPETRINSVSQKKGSRSKNWDKFIFSKIQSWSSLPLLLCATSMNALKFLEIVTNQLLKSFSVRTKFYISNISQFHLKRENLNQIGSNTSAKFSILLKKIPMNNDENIESD